MGVPLEVKVWGDFACFTRPENKVERVSYPVPTPSGARGVLEAIFWKPEFEWIIREVLVLKPVRYLSILRNEVGIKAVPSSEGISITGNRQQRHALILRDVAYVIRADMRLKRHATDNLTKYREQFQRYVERGQCYHRPYLGCREFACEFAPPDGNEVPHAEVRDENLGLMLFDIAFTPNPQEKRLTFWQHGSKRAEDSDKRERSEIAGVATPRFFEARLENGVMRIPPELYQRQAQESRS